jgi:transcriptional regulator with XRE-family HTH domain
METKHYKKFSNIGQKIKEYRKQNKLSQLELADKLGISLSYLTKIEAKNCKKSFSLALLFDIAEVLEIDIKKFFD